VNPDRDAAGTLESVGSLGDVLPAGNSADRLRQVQPA